MKIIDKVHEGVKFAALCPGSVFRFEAHYCIKTDDVYSDHVNAIDLASGEQYSIGYDEDVKIVEAELVIKGVHD